MLSNSAKSNRISSSSTIPGSPQEPLYSPPTDLVANRSNMPTIDEQEHLATSDDDDEQVLTQSDDEDDEQEEKLVVITTEINAKQKCLDMLESARKRSDAIRQRYEERIKLLTDRVQNAEEEKQAAVTKLSP